MYAFVGKDATELSIKEGEIINVLKTTETGWWKGQINEREGWFPSSYVMVSLNEVRARFYVGMSSFYSRLPPSLAQTSIQAKMGEIAWAFQHRLVSTQNSQ